MPPAGQQPSDPVGGASETRVWVGGSCPLRRPCLQTLAFGLMTTASSGDLTLPMEETLWPAVTAESSRRRLSSYKGPLSSHPSLSAPLQWARANVGRNLG